MTLWMEQKNKTSCFTTTFPPSQLERLVELEQLGRREIGHGKLAWRAVNPLLPSKEDFPYTIKSGVEITD